MTKSDTVIQLQNELSDIISNAVSAWALGRAGELTNFDLYLVMSSCLGCEAEVYKNLWVDTCTDKDSARETLQKLIDTMVSRTALHSFNRDKPS